MHVSRHNVLVDIEGHTEKILMNPLSQSMDVVDGEEGELVSLLRGEGSLECLENSDLDYLLERGYLFTSAEEEAHLLEQVIQEDDQEKYPVDFLLYPTFHCNFRCVYCFQEDFSIKYSFISEKYVDKAFKAMDSIVEDLQVESVPLLYLFGGEPLLKGKRARKTIQYVLSQARNNGYRTAVVTNGSNVSYYSDMLKQHTVEFIQITLDGPKHIHDSRRIYANGKGTFDDIAKGIESIIDSEMRILIRMNLDSQNIDYIPEFADFVLDSGWKRDNVTVFVGPYRDLLCRSYEHQLPEHVMLKRMFSFYEENPRTAVIGLMAWPGADLIMHFLKTRELPPPRISYCIANYGRFGFDAEGYVYACGNAAGKKEYAIGRYYPTFTIDSDKASIWRKRRFVTMPACQKCAIALLCGGGCTLQSLLKYQGKNPFCPEILENLKVAAAYYFDKIVGE